MHSTASTFNFFKLSFNPTEEESSSGGKYALLSNRQDLHSSALNKNLTHGSIEYSPLFQGVFIRWPHRNPINKNAPKPTVLDSILDTEKAQYEIYNEFVKYLQKTHFLDMNLFTALSIDYIPTTPQKLHDTSLFYVKIDKNVKNKLLSQLLLCVLIATNVQFTLSPKIDPKHFSEFFANRTQTNICPPPTATTKAPATNADLDEQIDIFKSFNADVNPIPIDDTKSEDEEYENVHNYANVLSNRTVNNRQQELEKVCQQEQQQQQQEQRAVISASGKGNNAPPVYNVNDLMLMALQEYAPSDANKPKTPASNANNFGARRDNQDNYDTSTSVSVSSATKTNKRTQRHVDSDDSLSKSDDDVGVSVSKKLKSMVAPKPKHTKLTYGSDDDEYDDYEDDEDDEDDDDNDRVLRKAKYDHSSESSSDESHKASQINLYNDFQRTVRISVHDEHKPSSSIGSSIVHGFRHLHLNLNHYGRKIVAYYDAPSKEGKKQILRVYDEMRRENLSLTKDFIRRISSSFKRKLNNSEDINTIIANLLTQTRSGCVDSTLKLFIIVAEDYAIFPTPDT